MSYFQFLLSSDNEGTPWYSEAQEEMPIPGDTLTELNVTVSPSFLPVILRVINSTASKTLMYGSIYMCTSGKRGRVSEQTSSRPDDTQPTIWG